MVRGSLYWRHSFIIMPLAACLSHAFRVSSRQGTLHRISRLYSSVSDTLQTSINTMRQKGTPEPEDSAIHLLAHAMGLPYETGFRQLRDILHTVPPTASVSTTTSLAKQLLSPTEQQRYKDLLARRMANEPIQYILGQWDFLEYTFFIQPPLLCPRPETEELVLLVEAYARQHNHPNIDTPLKVLDVGAGTGCIGISLAKRLDHVQVQAIDIEPVAIQVSQSNAKRVLGPDSETKYHVQLASALDYHPTISNVEYFDIIVSNPPYIPQRDMETLEPTVVQYESHDALCGGVDGMDVIRAILRNLVSWGRSGSICWMEVDPSQPPLIHREASEHGVEYISTIQDLSGRDRFVQLRTP